VRDRIGDPAGPAAGTLLARIEALRALLAGTLTVDTELGAAGPLATESTLAALATELGQKVEPADLAPLATGARQDAAKATLDAIAGALAGGPFATATGQGDLLAAVARDVTLQAVRDRVGDPAGPAAGTLLARIEQLRALLSGTLTVDTELSAAGPLATEASLAALTALISGGKLLVDTELSAVGLSDVLDRTSSVPLVGAAMLIDNGINLRRLASAASIADGVSLQGALAAATWLYNGSTFDRMRTSGALIGTAATASPGLGAVVMATDGTSLRNIITTNALGGDNNSSLGLLAAGQAGYQGSGWDRIRVANVWKTRADASITAGTPAAGWTPTTGKKFRLMSGQLSLAVAGQIILKDGATEILRSPKLAAGGVWDFDIGNGKLSAAANNVLNIDTSATGNVGGWLGGTEE
jgi:hypothetical protein